MSFLDQVRLATMESKRAQEIAVLEKAKLKRDQLIKRAQPVMEYIKQCIMDAANKAETRYVLYAGSRVFISGDIYEFREALMKGICYALQDEGFDAKVDRDISYGNYCLRVSW
jgi:TRAP-type mannitol/chloroaromatic compound transport system permease small subunit